MNDIFGFIIKAYPKNEKVVVIVLDVFGDDVATDIPTGKVVIHYET